MSVLPSRRRRARRSFARALESFGEMAALARQPETLARRAPAVSRWSVADQLEHLVLADRGILKTLHRLQAGEVDEGGGPTFAGRLVLLTRFIPRGAGQAHGVLHPKGVEAGDLRAAIAELESAFRDLEPELDALSRLRATARHPVLGRFDACRWLGFLDLHHRHHLRIVADIRRAAGEVESRESA